MATKTKKASSRTVHEHAEVQKAIKAIFEAQNSLSAGFSLSARGDVYLHEAKAALSEAASRLRDLLEGKGDGCSPRQGERTLPLGRVNVDGPLPSGSRPRSSKRRVESKARVPKNPPWTDEGFDDDLPF